MSKSKRAAQERRSPAPRQKKPILRDDHGRLRTAWLLAFSLCAYVAVAAGVRLGLTFALSRLFAAWNVNADTASRAPRLAGVFYAWHGSLLSLAASAAVLPLSGALRRLWHCPGGSVPAYSAKRLMAFVGVGAGISLAVAGLCLIPDSSRLTWPLTKPRLSRAMPVLCAFSFVGVLAEEAFGKRVLYDGIRERRGSAWAAAAAVIFAFMTGGGYAGNVVRAINAALLGALSCLIYAGYGFWASVGLRWGWSAVNAFLLGFGGGDAAIYRIYGVSETILTGGDAGPVYGLWTALLLSAGIAALVFGRKKKA